ncbi:CvpA family protein [Zunongwangia atlantica]|uniref:Colicin V production protein n=1 Tax=Zunongwangia atlantica 22II14-10F7 TaxID=1185767 RepID=A0A1Y1SYV5_9FLAO|nr:CvpA family protein [Zunongwangia atlantica]ORL43930.1 colicin V production protein [Zunongwangia atlantica 22II14-10F7]
MNTIDIILGIVLLYGLIRGFFRGLFAEIAALVGLIAGIYGAIYFSHILSDFLAKYVNWDEGATNLFAFAITFILILFLVTLAGKFLTKVANLAALGMVNKILGGAFGLLKLAFLASVVIMFFKATEEQIDIVEDQTIEESVLYRPVAIIAPTILPTILKEAKERDIWNPENTEEPENDDL